MSLTVLLVGGVGLLPTKAAAQAIALTVDGDPITSVDIEQRMKILRVLRKPATREAAVDSLIDDRVKTHDTAKYNIKPSDTDVVEQIGRAAQEMKMQPQALGVALQRSGASEEHIKAHFAAEYSFDILVQALNKGVEASEVQVRAELAKEGAKGIGNDYTLRQVIFTMPGTATVAALNERGRAAEQLRARFSGCDSGIAAAQAMDSVVVKDPITRSSQQLSDGLRDVLDKTPLGRLTPPQRSQSGLEMVAVCNKGQSKDDSAARAVISQRLLSAHIKSEKDRRLKELRSRAVVEKR